MGAVTGRNGKTTAARKRLAKSFKRTTPGVYRALTSVGGARGAKKVTSYMESIVTFETPEKLKKRHHQASHGVDSHVSEARRHGRRRSSRRYSRRSSRRYSRRPSRRSQSRRRPRRSHRSRHSRRRH